MVDSYISTKCGVHSISGFWENAFYSRLTYGRCPRQDMVALLGEGVILVLFSSRLSDLVLQVNGCAVRALCVPPPHRNLGGWWNLKSLGCQQISRHLIHSSASVHRRHNIVFSVPKEVACPFEVLNREVVLSVVMCSSYCRAKRGQHLDRLG